MAFNSKNRINNYLLFKYIKQCFFLTIALIVFILFFMHNANGQLNKYADPTRVYGYVENTSGEPLAFAAVKLLTVTDSLLIKGAAANSIGFFEFKNVPYGTYFLTFTSVASTPLFTRKFSIDSVASVVDLKRIQVSEKIFSMEEVVVSAKKPLLQIKKDKLVVNIENSFLATGNSITEVLPNLPSVSTSSNGVLLNGKPVLILIDGKGEFDRKGVKEMITNIGADQVEAIEIISNPSSRYDSNVQGIINIKLKKERNYSTARLLLQTQLAPEKGVTGIGYNRIAPGFTLNYGSGKFSTSTSFDFVNRASFEKLQDQTTMVGFQQVLRETKHVEQEHFLSYRTDLQYKINDKLDHLFGVTVGGFYNFSHEGQFDSQIQFMGSENYLKVDSTLNSWSHSDSKGINHNNITAYYSKKIHGGKQQLDVVYDFYLRDGKTNYRFQNELINKGNESSAANEEINSERDNVILGQALNINYVNTGHESLVWEAGTKLTKFTNSTYLFYNSLGADITSRALANTRYDYREYILAAYSSVSKSIGSINIDGGLRAEQVISEGETSLSNTEIGLDYFRLYPYVNSSYSINKHIDIRLSLSRKIARRLSFNDLNPALEYKNPLNIFSGNQDLRPQMTNKVYFSSVFKNKYMLSIFLDVDQNIRSLIPLLEDNEYFIFQTINIERGRSIGINLSAPMEIGSLWKINGNIGLYDHIVTAKKYGLSSKSFNCSTFLANEFRISDNSQVQFNINYTTPFSYGFYRSDAFFTTFLSANFYLLNKQGVLSLKVSDLFGTGKLNSENRYYESYLQQTMPVTNQRNASVKFTYRFKTGQKVKNENKSAKSFGEIRFN